MKCVLFFLLLVFSWSCTMQTGNRNTSNDNDTVKAVGALPAANGIQSDSIRKYSKMLERFYNEAYPSGVADKWYLPFELPDRSDLKLIHVISNYGANRSSYVNGHKHSGIDVVPFAGSNVVNVYPISKGAVCFVKQEAPNKTVIVKHRLKDGSFLYSAYIHLKEILVKNGEKVDQNSKIGVLYTKREALRYHGYYDHLHLEIKKRIDDYSCASWLCMSREEMDEYFMNPADFLKLSLSK